MAIDHHPVAAVAIDFGLDEQFAAVVVHHLSTDDGGIGAVTNQRIDGCTAKRLERGEIRQRLGQIGLALAIVTNDGSGTRDEIELGCCVVAEIDKLQRPHQHDGTLPRVGRAEHHDTRTGISKYR